MIFRISGPRGAVLPVTLSDVVHAITATHPGLRWFVPEFYGVGNANVRYPGNRTYTEFADYMASTRSLLTDEELLSTAAATFDIYDVLLVGVHAGEAVERYVGHDPAERFQVFANKYAVVAECVDSGFWRISIKDETRGKKIASIIAAIPGATISDDSFMDAEV